MKSFRRPTSGGFTIVELLVVIVVIGILAAITIVSYTGISQKANIASVISDLNNNSKLLKMYYIDNSSYPTAMNGSNCPTAPASDPKYCLKSSSGTTLNYQPSNSSTNAADFSLYATKDNLIYRTSSDTQTTPISTTMVCPYGFIAVPGSATYSTSNFCVMKYEAKQVGATTMPISTASGTPWLNISQTTAITNSPNVSGCTGCHLITEAEWLTIAQNVLSVAINWSSGIVGTGYIYSGHNDNVPASALAADVNDANGYVGETNTGGNQKRTLTLNNSEVIWDLAGNVWEWTSGQTTGGQPGINGAGYNWRDWTSITNSGTLSFNPSPTTTGISGSNSWNSSFGMGTIYSSSDETVLKGFLRSGNWGNFGTSGVLALYLANAPSTPSSSGGFRVSK